MSYFLVLKFFVFIFISTTASSTVFSSDNDAVVDDNDSNHYSLLSIMNWIMPLPRQIYMLKP